MTNNLIFSSLPHFATTMRVPLEILDSPRAVALRKEQQGHLKGKEIDTMVWSLHAGPRH